MTQRDDIDIPHISRIVGQCGSQLALQEPRLANHDTQLHVGSPG